MNVKNDVSMFLGTVAEAVSAGYGYAKIYVSTESYYAPVETPAEARKVEFEFDNGEGIVEKIERRDSSTLIAQWICIGNPNKRSSPSFTGGETVLVIRIAGIKKYFFTTFFSDLDLKAQDITEFIFPSRPRIKRSEEEESETDPNKPKLNTFRPDPEMPGNEITASYKFTIDTTDGVQQVFFRTSAYNGERSILTANFDCKNGKIMFFNDRGEMVSLESSLPGADAESTDDDVPGRLRFTTSGHLLHRSNKAMYQELLDGAYSKLTGNEFKEITKVAMTRIGCDIKEVKGPAVYSYQDKVCNTCKGDFGIKTLTGNAIIESGGDIGLTTLSGKMKIFSGSEITVISPKVNFVSPAVSVTGTLTGAAISMGSAPSADNTPLQIKSDEIKWDKFEEEMENVTKINTIVQPEEEEKKEEKKKEENKEEEKKPDNIDGKAESKDAIMQMDGKFHAEVKETVLINGQGGTSIKGGGQDLIQILENLIQDLQTAFASDLGSSQITGTCPEGPIFGSIIPSTSNFTQACAKAKSALNTFKGQASRMLRSSVDDELVAINQTADTQIPESNLTFRLSKLKNNLDIKKRKE